MSKKLLCGFVFSLFAVSAFAQTIVSTTPENKKVILEEYTGINCVFCPDGHAIAQAIRDANEENVFLINIHTGGFANPGAGQPDFRTPFGAAIASQAGVTGYPQGSVNRQVFSGGVTAMGRGQWAGASTTVLGQSAYLNMGVEATLDVSTSELVVRVEAFYTANSPEATNKLNVALLQNNTTGPQTGGGMGNNYVHQHRLVHLITGQWGDDVSPTTASSLIDETYNYTIPANYNGVPVVLEDLELVVFMTETQQDVISGNGIYPEFVNLPLDNDILIESNMELEDQCGIDFGPTVTIQNRGNDQLTSLAIEYSINSGTVATYNWTGDLGPFQSEEIALDPISYVIEATNTVNISIPSDDNNANNTATNTFAEITQENTSNLNLRMSLDADGDEVTWEIINTNGDTVQTGGPYAADEEVDLDFSIPDIDCYKFILTDSGGNGMYFVRLKDSNGDSIIASGTTQSFGASLEGSFRLNGVLGVTDAALEGVAIYPNPATSVLNIRNAEAASIVVFDILGKKLIQMDNISLDQEIDVASLQTGTYLVKITNGAAVKTEKFIIAR